MKRRIEKFMVVAFSVMLMTPIFTAPKLPVIPNISASVTLPAGAKESAKKAGQEAVKNLKIDWSKIKFNY